MALMEMNDHVEGIEALRAFNVNGIPTQYPLGVNGLGAETGAVFGPHPLPTDSDCAKWLDDNSISGAEYKRRGCGDDGKVIPGFSQGSQESWKPSNKLNPSSPAGDPGAPGKKPSTWQEIATAINQIAPSVAPLFKKRPKQKFVVQKEPDYTTYAVIGGAVIVASVLAIAIGKSGARRRD